MEKVFVVFSERTDYIGNKVRSCNEQLWPMFFTSDAQADAHIEKVIKNIVENNSNASAGRHIVIIGDTQYRYRIAELKAAYK